MSRDWSEQLRDSTIDLIAQEAKEAADKRGKAGAPAATIPGKTSVGSGRRKPGGKDQVVPVVQSPAKPLQPEELSTDILNDSFLAQLPHVACLGPSNEVSCLFFSSLLSCFPFCFLMLFQRLLTMCFGV